MASQIGLLLISLVLSKGIDLTSGKECKFEHKYICGIQDCNCRYVSENGVSVSSLYRRFLAMFSQDQKEFQVCDKCDVFCSKEKHINCHHGACDKQKGCICRDCWTGETCSKYHNRQPEFKQSLYVAEIKENTNVGDEILKVSAFDYDLETCVDKHNCPCGRVKYSINKGNEDGLFYINPDSGVINLTRKLYGQYDPISLTILAKNGGDLNTVEENQSNKAMATVVITSVQNYDNGGRERRSLHHRTRRSVTTYDSLEITFEAVTNETFFSAGCTINYRLYLVQNSSASPQQLTSMSIQLSSENLELGDGYSVNVSNVIRTPGSIKRPNANTVQFATGTLEANGYMEIKFNGSVRDSLDPLALLQVVFTMNATTSRSVTYGPKYSSELYTTYPIIKFARTTEGAVEVETTLDYNVNITLPYFNFTFVFEITTIVNDFRFLSIENVQLGPTSGSVKAEYPNPTPMIYTGADDNITSRVVLDFGNIKVLNTDQDSNEIKLSFSVKVNDHHLLENASTHWVGVGANSGEEMLWVGQDAITFLKDEPYLHAEIQAMNKTNPTRYYINDLLIFSWNVKHAENGSYEDASDVKVFFYFSSSLERVAVTGMSGDPPPVTTEAGRTVFTYSHSGGTLAQGNDLTGTIKARVKDTVTPLADLNVEIKIQYKTSKSEVRPIRTYKPNPGYLAGVPSFNLSSNAPDRLVNFGLVNIGQLVDITVKILVRKMTLEGELYVILPVVNSSAIMRFVPHESFKDKSYGLNILAPAFTSSEATFNSTSSNKTYYDRAEIALGQIKNNAVTDSALASADDNTVTLSFRVVLEDNNYVVNRSNYKIGVGVKGSQHMIWISQMTFIANVLLTRQPRLLIEAHSMNASDSLVQGSVVEYNFTISYKETSGAHAIDVEVLWMLPVYTKYLHTNQNSGFQIVNSGNNVAFKLSKLDFGETPSVSFSVALDPDKTLTKSGKNYAVTPVALTYQNKQQNTYYEPLVPMSVHFKVPVQPVPKPPNAVVEFYQRGFLIDNSTSAIYICSVSSKRHKPSCFWTDTKGATWRAVDVMVISIIGIDNANNMVYGVGNNMMSYMKYVPNKGKWYSISRDQWQQAQSTLSDHEVVKIEESDADEDVPASNKQKTIASGEKWGATKSGVFHYSSQNPGWKRKALWNSCN